MLCKACGKEIAKSAKVCPHCGKRDKKPFWQKLIVFFVIIGILVIIRMISNNGKTSTTSLSNTTTSPSNTIMSSQEATIIDWVDFEFTPGYNVPGTIFQADFFWAKQDGKQVSVTNNGKLSSLTIFHNAPQRYDFKLYDQVTIVFKVVNEYSRDIVSITAR